LDTEDVVVGREHAESGFRDASLGLDSDLGVINTREVAGTGWLVLFWLERERVGVDTWRWGAGVVNEWLDLVEVLTRLFLEAVLAVEDKLEGVEGTVGFFGEVGALGDDKWGTAERAGDEAVRFGWELENVRGDGGVRVGSAVGVSAIIKAEDEFLDWVVVRKTLLDFLTGSDGVSASVLHLLDEVFVTLLREAAALFGVEVDVVGPDLEGGTVSDGAEGRGQIEVEADFVVLEGNQWKRQTWVAVEEEDEWQEDLVTSLGGGGHLTVVRLLGFIQVKLGVQTPPLLVVLVDALATDGKFNILDGTFGEPRVISDGGGTSLEFDIHVGDEITVASNGDGNATIWTWGTVDGLFDVFHSEVRVTLVHGLEESDFWVARKIDILGTVRDELHETTGHFESFVLYTKKIISRKNSV